MSNFMMRSGLKQCITLIEIHILQPSLDPNLVLIMNVSTSKFITYPYDSQTMNGKYQFGKE